MHLLTFRARRNAFGTLGLLLIELTALPVCCFGEVAIIAPSKSFPAINGDSQDTYGWSFTVGATDLTVTGLGIWDDDMDGFHAAHPVGIWDGAGVLLGSATVPSGTAAPLFGEFRIQPLVDSFTLLAGTGYTIGAFFQDDDRFLAWGDLPTPSPFIAEMEPRSHFGTQLEWPTYGPQPGSSPAPYVGPTFSFIPAPEAGPLLPLAGMIVFIAGLRKASTTRPR